MGLCLHSTGVYIVTEYVPGGDLTVYIDDFQLEFTWKIVVKIILQLAQAIGFLHAKNILVRENILFFDNNRL